MHNSFFQRMGSGKADIGNSASAFPLNHPLEATSGDVTGDYSQVVGYGAAVIWKE